MAQASNFKASNNQIPRMALLDENVANEKLDDVHEGDHANGLPFVVNNENTMDSSLCEGIDHSLG